MPTTRRRKYVARRRPIRRRVTRPRRTIRRRRVAAVYRAPFPREKYCSLRYNDSFTMSSTSGATTVQTFYLNSLFDPDSTGTGHQPRYFDTFCGADGTGAPYGKYRVHSAKITVTFMNNNTSSGSIGYVGIRLRNTDATVTSSDANIPELPNTKYRLCNVATGMSNYFKITYPCTMKTFMGIKDLKDDDLSAAVYSSSPSRIVAADAFYYPRDESTTATIQCDVWITFNVQFFDQNMPATS